MACCEDSNKGTTLNDANRHDSDQADRSLTIAIAGNPNCGKSALFNTFTGIRQKTGNWPGVTVEKKTGLMDHGGRRYELVDLPGLYSLAPRSRDEMVAVDALLGRMRDTPRPEAVVVVDATNLERNLYLVVNMARQYSSFGVSVMDLVQEGNAALIRAVEKYDWQNISKRLALDLYSLCYPVGKSAHPDKSGSPNSTTLAFLAKWIWYGLYCFE